MKLVKRIGKGLAGLLVLLLLVEVALRIWPPYAPFIHLDGMTLYANMEREVSIINPGNALPAKVRYGMNAQGFRGTRNWPEATVFPIYCVGNSSAYCPLLSDDATWPATLHRRLAMSFDNVEVLNASIDGSSVQDQREQLQGHLSQLPAGYALLMPGIDPMEGHVLAAELNRPNVAPQACSDCFSPNWQRHIRITAYVEHWMTERQAISIDFAKWNDALQLATDSSIWHKHIPKQPDFQVEMVALVEAARAAGHEPVLITQPLPDARETERWQAMELYNETIRDVAITRNTKLIDLGRLLPKEGDWFLNVRHFSPDGAEKVAELIHAPMRGWLKARQ